MSYTESQIRQIRDHSELQAIFKEFDVDSDADPETAYRCVCDHLFLLPEQERASKSDSESVILGDLGRDLRRAIEILTGIVPSLRSLSPSKEKPPVRPGAVLVRSMHKVIRDGSVKAKDATPRDGSVLARDSVIRDDTVIV
jgi:hypothetical protein